MHKYRDRALGYWALVGCLSATLACTLPAALTAKPTAFPPSPTAMAVPSVTAMPTTGDSVSATPQQTPTQSVILTTSPPIDPSVSYAVVLVKEGDVLNVRSNAGVQYPIVDTLDAHAKGIRLTTGQQKIGEALWVEIVRPAGGTGWVNAYYLTEEASPEDVCADERVHQLLMDFENAVRLRDGEALAQLVSPTHGLMIRHEWWNPQVTFQPGEVAILFEDTRSHDWGIADGSGLPIQGSFQEVILPRLLDVLESNYTMHCNTLETGVATGGTAGLVILPYEYANFRYYAFYRAGSVGMEMDWRTWAIGIEYVNGKPRIVFLVQYHWEI